MKATIMKDKTINMQDSKDVILDYLAMNRDFYKEKLRLIQIRRNKMYETESTSEWEEINQVYEDAIFLELYDDLSQKLNLPVDELYCILLDLSLSDFFEPAN